MLRKLACAILAGWLACAPNAPALAQASADQMNKLSLESLTANPGGGSGYSSYRPRAARRAYAVRRYRTAARHGYAMRRYRTVARHSYAMHRYRYGAPVRHRYAARSYRTPIRRAAHYAALRPRHRAAYAMRHYGPAVHRVHYRRHLSYHRHR